VILRRVRRDAPASGRSDDPPHAVLARRLLTEAREELARADQKAQMLLAALGIAGGVLLTGLLAGSWSPFQLDNRIEWLWWLGVLTALGSVVALGIAVRPRARRGVPFEGVWYFHDVTAYRSRAKLNAALRQQATDLFDRDVDQLYVVARLVALKYTWIERSMVGITIAAVCCTLGVLADLAL